MIDARMVLEARLGLAESKSRLWSGEEGSQQTYKKLERYWSKVGEQQVDGFLEYLRRFCSVKNQWQMEVQNADPLVRGVYYTTGEICYGQPVFLSTSGDVEFRAAYSSETGAYYWQVRQVPSGDVLWVSSGGGVTEVELGDDLALDELWPYTDDHVLVPKALGAAVASLSMVCWTRADERVLVEGWEFLEVAGVLPVGLPDLSMSVPSQDIVWPSVTDPQVNHGKVREGVWRAGGVRVIRDEDGRFGAKGFWVIIQSLNLELNQTAEITASGSRWRLKGGEYPTSGQRNLVLELPFVDPAVAHDLADGLNAGGNVFNSSIFTINAGMLEGKFYHVAAQVKLDEATGYATVLWFVRNHDNTDLIFVHLASPNVRRVDFFKLHLPSEGVSDFKDHYYFTASGHVYVSTDEATYTMADGVAATGDLPLGACRLDAEDFTRRVVAFSPKPDGEGEVNVHLVLEYRVEPSPVGIIFANEFGGIVTDLSVELVDPTVLRTFMERLFVAATGEWYESADGVGYTSCHGQPAVGFVADVAAENLLTNVEGRAVQVQVRPAGGTEEWSVAVRVQHGTNDQRLSGADAFAYKPVAGSQLLMDQGFGVSREDLEQAKLYYNAVAEVGTTRKIEVVRTPDGLYNFTAVELVRAGSSVVMELGSSVHYWGHYMPLPPTTDAAEDPAKYTILAGIGFQEEVSAQVDQNEDGSWNWHVIVRSPPEKDWQSGQAGGGALVEFGKPYEVVREWVYTGQTGLPNGGVSDVGSYAADGRSLTFTHYAVSVDAGTGTLSWKKTETVLSCPLGWLRVGAQASYEHDHRMMRNWAQDKWGDQWKTYFRYGDGFDDKINMLNLYYAQVSRRRVVTVVLTRKYFIQPPTEAQLTAAGVTTTLEATLGVKESYEVSQVGPHLFALTHSVTNVGLWQSDLRELINYTQTFMTKSLWTVDCDNPAYNDSATPVMAKQQVDVP